MTIEARAYFLGTIPVGPRFEVRPGEELAGDARWNMEGLVRAIISTIICDIGFAAFCIADPSKEIRVVNNSTVEYERGGQRVTISGGEINLAELRSPTMVPGLKLQIGFRKYPPVITLGKGEYKILK